MAEYIERKALREAFDNADADIVEEYGDGDCDWGFGRQNILEVINSVPSADVAPVRHGRWDDYGAGVCCTNCGVSLFHQDENNNFGIEPSAFRYCPYCGAIMDDAE